MDICGQNSAVSNMCRCAENALKGHTVSELQNQPSKHIHQLTSSASFLTKVQATTEPHTLFQQREKGSRLRPANETHNHEKQICTNEHHRNTQTRIQLSLSQSNIPKSRGSCKMVGRFVPSPSCHDMFLFGNEAAWLLRTHVMHGDTAPFYLSVRLSCAK